MLTIILSVALGVFLVFWLPYIQERLTQRANQVDLAHRCMTESYEAASRLIEDETVPPSVRRFIKWFQPQVSDPTLARHFVPNLIEGELARASSALSLEGRKLQMDFAKLTREQIESVGQMIGSGMVSSAYADPRSGRKYASAWLLATMEEGQPQSHRLAPKAAEVVALNLVENRTAKPIPQPTVVRQREAA